MNENKKIYIIIPDVIDKTVKYNVLLRQHRVPKGHTIPLNHLNLRR